jgi:outer membrane protein
MNRNWKTFVGLAGGVAALIGLCTSSAVYADRPPPDEVEVMVETRPPPPPGAPAAEEGHWKLGVGAGIRPDYEGSNDYEPWPVGMFRYTWPSDRFVELGGAHGSGKAARLRANLIPGGTFLLGPVLQLRPSRGDVDNNFVHRMPNVDMAGEAGGFIGMAYEQFNLTATAATDVTGAAKSGTTLELATGFAQRVTDLISLGAGVSSTWASDDYMQTYFGVNAGESAQSGLPTYNPDSDFKDVGANVSLGFHPSGWENWSIVTLASYARLIGDADDSSPVVDVGSENQMFGGLMFVYEN